MTTPDVARSMAAHPSSQRRKISHLLCPNRLDVRLCGKPASGVFDPSALAQWCVVCNDLANYPCPHCGQMHERPS